MGNRKNLKISHYTDFILISQMQMLDTVKKKQRLHYHISDKTITYISDNSS